MELSRNLWLGFAAALPAHSLSLAPVSPPAQGTSVTVDLERAVKLLLRASRASQQPALGLHLGRHAPMQTLGILGEVLTHAPTLRAALVDLPTYLPLLLFPQSRFQLLESGERAYLTYEAPFSDRVAARFCVELCLAFALRVGQQLVPGHAALELRVQHEAPSYADCYEPLLGQPVQFGAARNEIVFPRAALDEQQPFFDDALWLLVKQRAGELLQQGRSRGNLHERVRHVLRHEVDVSDVNLSEVARKLNLSLRALRARLTSEGQPLSKLVDEARMEHAQRLVLESGLPNKQIADKLGFSEVSAFHRAFRRWTGLTPMRYRISTLQAARA